ncbi:MAG: DUF3467 domain-containing protein [Bacteroidales bacterium]|nr:DUF3467 domain-containing protein [Bacteroidales bacterium]
MDNNNENKLSIDVPVSVADGVYSNFAVINHKQGEFVMDFCSMMPGVSGARVKSRIVSNPENAKLFLNALAENVKMYEQKFGPIGDKSNNGQPTIRFNGPQGEA